jgi:hypothetical protein
MVKTTIYALACALMATLVLAQTDTTTAKQNDNWLRHDHDV